MHGSEEAVGAAMHPPLSDDHGQLKRRLRPMRSLKTDQESGPAALAAVEAGKMAAASVRDADRNCDALSSWIRMVLGTTDRNCRLLP